MHRFEVRELKTFWQRLRGLLGAKREGGAAGPVLIGNCGSVHTFGMRYPLDIAFVNTANYVVAAYRDVSPGKVLTEDRALYVLERPSSQDAWPLKGQRLHVQTKQENGKELMYVQF